MPRPPHTVSGRQQLDANPPTALSHMWTIRSSPDTTIHTARGRCLEERIFLDVSDNHHMRGNIHWTHHDSDDTAE